MGRHVGERKQVLHVQMILAIAFRASRLREAIVHSDAAARDRAQAAEEEARAHLQQTEAALNAMLKNQRSNSGLFK